jgi:signal transduction histidine kinase
MGTRIFVELEEANGKAVATIKNIAGYEIDFTADEILQRFNRGDKSRNTEGSGLGLSIAESFTNVCGGELKVDIDGDLFKVTIYFNLNN